ncbi:hypothetical protein BDZ89DRAFT_1052835 [Hymenopellis radicata]|nr:hypothetical protein BDZ89DRAFT_1052835 [Hymenopellis radicata]
MSCCHTTATTTQNTWLDVLGRLRTPLLGRRGPSNSPTSTRKPPRGQQTLNIDDDGLQEAIGQWKMSPPCHSAGLTAEVAGLRLCGASADDAAQIDSSVQEHRDDDAAMTTINVDYKNDNDTTTTPPPTRPSSSLPIPSQLLHFDYPSLSSIFWYRITQPPSIPHGPIWGSLRYTDGPLHDNEGGRCWPVLRLRPGTVNRCRIRRLMTVIRLMDQETVNTETKWFWGNPDADTGPLVLEVFSDHVEHALSCGDPICALTLGAILVRTATGVVRQLANANQRGLIMRHTGTCECERTASRNSVDSFKVGSWGAEAVKHCLKQRHCLTKTEPTFFCGGPASSSRVPLIIRVLQLSNVYSWDNEHMESVQDVESLVQGCAPITAPVRHRIHNGTSASNGISHPSLSGILSAPLSLGRSAAYSARHIPGHPPVLARTDAPLYGFRN